MSITANMGEKSPGIQLGAKPEHGFDEPLGLLSDCHRRVEKFLDQLLLIAQGERGRKLSADRRQALETALRYFQQGAPLHTRDEEESLFPLMRNADSPEVVAALADLDTLEADHDAADIAHAEVDALGLRWLSEGTLPDADAARLIETLKSLRETYRRHIALEDNVMFPLAARILEAGALETVGREMAVRRGLDPDNLPAVSRCASRRLLREGGVETGK